MVGCQSLRKAYKLANHLYRILYLILTIVLFVVEHPLDNQEVQEYVATRPLWLRLYGQH